MQTACRRSGSDASLVVALESPPVTFDPRGPTDADTAHVQQLLFDTLVQRNDQYEIVPGLAERWEADESGVVYRFHLRPGIRFHDGSDLAAADVAYTFESLIAPGFDSPKRAAFSKLQQVKVIDPQTVEFHCREQYPGLLADLLAVGIIPEGTGETMADHPVGTGPFRFQNYVESQEINLEAFPDAFQGTPSIQQLKIKIVRDPTTLSLELLSGTVHLSFNTRLSPDFVREQQRSDRLKVAVADGANLEYLVLNTEDKLLSDRRVRQAIAYGLDRRAIIESVLQGQGTVADTIFPLRHWAFNAEVARYAHDPEKARQLLDQAGYRDPDGEGPKPRFRLVFKGSSAERSRQIATIIQEQLRAIGIEVELQSFEFQTYLGDLNRGQFQMGFLRLVGGHYFPDIFKGAFGSRSIPFDSSIEDEDRTGFLNRARYRNPEVDRLIAQAEATKDRQAQVRVYHQLQKVLTEDLPWVYLWYPANVAVMSPRVGNVHIPASGDFFFIKNLTFEQSH